VQIKALNIDPRSLVIPLSGIIEHLAQNLSKCPKFKGKVTIQDQRFLVNDKHPIRL